MFFAHIRPVSPLRALATLVLGVAFLSTLFMPAQVPNENRLTFAINWRM